MVAKTSGRAVRGQSIAEFPIPTAAGLPSGIAAGSDGAIWFAEFGGNRIGRITPAGAITEFPIPTPESGPTLLAAGPDGANGVYANDGGFPTSSYQSTNYWVDVVFTP